MVPPEATSFTGSVNVTFEESTTSLLVSWDPQQGAKGYTVHYYYWDGQVISAQTLMISSDGLAHYKILSSSVSSWGVPSTDQRGVSRLQVTGTTPYDRSGGTEIHRLGAGISGT